METRISRKRAASSSPSSISGSDKRSISPKRGPSTPMKSSKHRDNSEEERDPNDRDSSFFVNQSKITRNEPSSPIMSDTEQSQQKKRSHHRHHHQHHHKQSKAKKRSATHHKHSVKRRYLMNENRFLSNRSI